MYQRFACLLGMSGDSQKPLESVFKFSWHSWTGSFTTHSLEIDKTGLCGLLNMCVLILICLCNCTVPQFMGLLNVIKENAH